MVFALQTGQSNGQICPYRSLQAALYGEASQPIQAPI